MADVTTAIRSVEPTALATREALDRLAGLDRGEADVLTVYLDLRPDRRAGRTWPIVIKDLAHDAREGLDRGARAAFDADAERVQGWLDDELEPDAPGRGLVVFASSTTGLWETYRLPAVERDELAYQPTPHLAPLIDIIEDYERYAVAHVNDERTRLFTVFMGQIEEGKAFTDDVPGKYVVGHLKRAIRALSALHKRGAFDRLVLAGPEEATSELRTLLPRALASRLVDVVPMEVSAGSARILDATLEIERRVEREAEDRLISELFEAVAVDGFASCDLVPTIHALELRAIRTLVVAHGLRIAGSECPDCGWLEEGTVRICPIDGFSMRANDDIVDVAVRRTLVAKGEIEVVHDAAARRLIESCGGIGAALRFRAG